MAVRKMLDRLASACAGHEAVDVRQVQGRHVHPASEQMSARCVLPVLLRCLLRCVHPELMRGRAARLQCFLDFRHHSSAFGLCILAFRQSVCRRTHPSYVHFVHFLSRWSFARACASPGPRGTSSAGRSAHLPMCLLHRLPKLPAAQSTSLP